MDGDRRRLGGADGGFGGTPGQKLACRSVKPLLGRESRSARPPRARSEERDAHGAGRRREERASDQSAATRRGHVEVGVQPEEVALEHGDGDLAHSGHEVAQLAHALAEVLIPGLGECARAVGIGTGGARVCTEGRGRGRGRG